MKAFEYAAPQEETEIVGLLASHWGESELLAGGTDLIGLMKKMVVTPNRVVNIKNVASLRGINVTSQGVTIGATTTLDDVLDHPAMADYPGVLQAIRGINSIQLQSQGTLGGELCQRPRCWYFRSGQGLMAERGAPIVAGDNRYHAIFANGGPAKFVSASRLAPALIAHGASVRLIGPAADDETLIPLENFYRSPRDGQQRETVLQPNQVVTHVQLPSAEGWSSATYEVRHGEGPDYPLVAAAAALLIENGRVARARVVLGQVAPIPWTSFEAEQTIVGQLVNPQTARAAGEAAVAKATPLSDNGYKVQLAQVAVQRALLLAAGLETGGF
jgi:xanthine dehydrogenase YagS FAD-binding subunit